MSAALKQRDERGLTGQSMRSSPALHSELASAACEKGASAGLTL